MDTNGIPDTGPVLVTGGSGFIALELISQLLSRGYTVHTTVRSLQNHSKVQPLRHLRDCHPEGKLLLFEADLLQDGSFRPAMQACNVVYHVASPFKMAEKIKDGEKEMLTPALQGTRNVLSTVQDTPTVTRVVLTSSIGAIAGDWQDILDHNPDGRLREEHFNETSTVQHNPYHCSKVLAEREAWKMYEAQEQKRWHLVVLCVALVLGPTPAASSESGSLYLLDELLSGWMCYGVPDLYFAIVDIRDVAAAHIRAAEVERAKGRYIVSQGPGTLSFLQISTHFKRLRGGSLWLPAHKLSSSLVRILGPLFGLTQKWMSRNLGINYTIENMRSVDELGIQYRPVEDTLNAHFESWERNKKGRSSS